MSLLLLLLFKKYSRKMIPLLSIDPLPAYPECWVFGFEFQESGKTI